MLDESSYKLSRDELLRKDLQKHVKRYDLRTRPQCFNVGQKVLLHNFVQSCAEKRFNAKLAPLFVRARVKEKLGSHYYVLNDLTPQHVLTFYGKDIRLYVEEKFKLAAVRFFCVIFFLP